MRSVALFIVGLLILAFTIPTAGVGRQNKAVVQLCNGYPELCNRKLSNITFLGAHDSFAVPKDCVGDIAQSSNQYLDVSQQLSAGIRMLQGQGQNLINGILNPGGVVDLCHTSCQLLYCGTLTNYLNKVATFLKANPNEVIIILWVNGDSNPTIPVTDWAKSYVETGLDKISYIPAKQPLFYDEWPTLAELIANNTRVITFMDVGANTSVVPYILDEFSQIWETTIDPVDQSFPCSPRSNNVSNRTDIMYLMNHDLNKQISPQQFNNITIILVPDKKKLNTTNAASGNGSIEFAVDNCVAIYGRNPSIILVDFFNIPSVNGVLQAQADLNGLNVTLRS